jgi:hypothetical protein
MVAFFWIGLLAVVASLGSVVFLWEKIMEIPPINFEKISKDCETLL